MVAERRLEISFENQRLEDILSSDRESRRVYGASMSQTIQRRLGTLADAATLEEAQQRRALGLHQLRGVRAGQFAVHLENPYRMILRPNHNSIPRRQDGGIILSQVTAITVIEIVDYH